MAHFVYNVPWQDMAVLKDVRCLQKTHEEEYVR